MKEGIHPNYREVCFVDLSNGFKFVTRSTVQTKETVKMDDGRELPLFKLETTSERTRSTPARRRAWTTWAAASRSSATSSQPRHQEVSLLGHELTAARLRRDAQRQLRLPFSCLTSHDHRPGERRVNQPTPALVTQRAVRACRGWRCCSSAPPMCCRAVRPRPLARRRPGRLRPDAGDRRGPHAWLAVADAGRLPSRPPCCRTGWARWPSAAGQGWLDPPLAARLPFALLLVLVLVLTWYATYHLARTDAAQPLPFAFGGEADPVDYARAMADGALLALIATLGLLQLGHETTPELVQLAAGGLFCLWALAAAPFRPGPRVAGGAAGAAAAGRQRCSRDGDGPGDGPGRCRAVCWRSSYP
jgi:ribosomal protein L31